MAAVRRFIFPPARWKPRRVPTDGREGPGILGRRDGGAWVVAATPSRGDSLGGDGIEGPQIGESCDETIAPGPVEWAAKRRSAGSIHQARRNTEVTGSERVSDDEMLALGNEVAEGRYPTDEVVSQDGAAHPRRVRREAS
jgi:hypothetical protein